MTQTLTRYGRTIFEEAGNQVVFMARFVRNVFKSGFEWNEFIRQCYIIGYKSFSIVAVTGFIIGLVIALQSYPTMKSFGAHAFVPSMVSISVVRELGPVIIALICAGKISSGIGAELGSMNVTEQIKAMEVSGANPMQYLVVTRILACTVMIPILIIIGDSIALCGGLLGVNLNSFISVVLYFYKSFNYMFFSDVVPALIKSVFFGFAIGFVGCYKGYTADSGTEGVGAAANSAVVSASLWIILMDAIAVQLTNIFVYLPMN